jgi:hypothetical protein
MTDVFQNILQNLSQVRDKHDLAGLILNECSSTCFETTRLLEEDFQFLDMFENSIGAVVSINFSNFVIDCLPLDEANCEATCYERFTKTLETSDGLDLSNIKEESKLLREIKDILDELNMMLMVFKEQSQIRDSITLPVMEPVSQCILKIKTMQEQARVTYESVRISISISCIMLLNHCSLKILWISGKSTQISSKLAPLDNSKQRLQSKAIQSWFLQLSQYYSWVY